MVARRGAHPLYAGHRRRRELPPVRRRPGPPGRPGRDLTPFDGVKVGVVDVPRGDPDHVLISTNRRDRGLFDVERLNLDDRRDRARRREPRQHHGVAAPTARAGCAARSRRRPTGDHQVLVRDTEDQPFRVLADYANEDSGQRRTRSATTVARSTWAAPATVTWCGSLRSTSATGEERRDRRRRARPTWVRRSSRTEQASCWARRIVATASCCTRSTRRSPATGSACARSTRAIR